MIRKIEVVVDSPHEVRVVAGECGRYVQGPLPVLGVEKVGVLDCKSLTPFFGSPHLLDEPCKNVK